MRACSSFKSNIYPGALCAGLLGCGRPWELHPESRQEPCCAAPSVQLISDDGYECLACGMTFGHRRPGFDLLSPRQQRLELDAGAVPDELKPCHAWVDIDMLVNDQDEWEPLPAYECAKVEGHAGKHVPAEIER